MSQFILCNLKEINAVKNSFYNIINNNFLLKKSYFLFPEENTEYIYAINNFDKICMSDQKSLCEGKKLEHTVCYDLISYLVKNRCEFFMWYSDDCNDLESFSDLHKILCEVERSLKQSSGEIYLHYKIENYN